MAFRVGDFTAYVQATQGVAFANHFDVAVTMPLGVQSLFTYGPTDGVRTLNFMCEAAELPGLDITPVEYRHHAFIRRVPHHMSFTPLTLTFYCDKNFGAKKIFDVWAYQCVNKSTGLLNYRLDGSGNPQYEGTVTINQYGPDGSYLYLAQADEAFPISVSPISVGWADDSIERFTVTFVYTRWWTFPEGGLPSSTPVPENTINGINNIGAEVSGLIAGINTLVNARNPAQLLSGLQQSQAVLGDITQQVNTFSNQVIGSF